MEIGNKTIEDFGIQWTKYDSTDGYFGSKDLLTSFVTPFNPESFNQKVIADIGAGTGRFTLNLLEFGASHVYALEPSIAVNVLRKKTETFSSRVTIINKPGDALPSHLRLDYAISIGVLHHVPDPIPIFHAVYDALESKGKFIFWLYGKEGNQLYLYFVNPIRRICQFFPSFLISFISNILNLFLMIYTLICRMFPSLPLSHYLVNIISKLPWKKRTVVIYDQLAPAYAKYYSHKDCVDLMEKTKFEKFEIHHRMGYSWVIIAEKL